MSYGGKFSLVLHVLLHLTCSGRRWSSEELATHLGTNPVVIRRALANLRQEGYVESTKGHGGGWKVICDAKKVTLHDIYQAVGEPTIFALANPLSNQKCLIEKTVHASLGRSLDEAKKLLMHRLKEITLAEISAEFCNSKS